MSILKYTKLDPSFPDLKRGSEFSAGIDLYTCSDILLEPYDSTIVSCGITVEIPLGHFGQVSTRSGHGFKLGLASHHGVIDADYRGEVKLKLYSHDQPVSISKFDRVCQLIIIPFYHCKPELVEELSETERGIHGYGSTGLQ